MAGLALQSEYEAMAVRGSPMQPHALGEDMEVPFISWLFCSVQLGTEVTAPPGAVTETPRLPSVLQGGGITNSGTSEYRASWDKLFCPLFIERCPLFGG